MHRFVSHFGILAIQQIYRIYEVYGNMPLIDATSIIPLYKLSLIFIYHVSNSGDPSCRRFNINVFLHYISIACEELV